jgi:KUP system potassium uptake protein
LQDNKLIKKVVSNHKDLQKLSAAGLLISLGIIYGDIGTSPLYVFKAIVGQEHSNFSQRISETLVLGGVSLIFWTLTLQTTLKYVVITLRADNKGEGGIFSLFSLVRRKAKWLNCTSHFRWLRPACRWYHHPANYHIIGY